jgi:hypothetical protein
VDVCAVLGAADRIDDLATQLRARANLIALHGANVHWNSPAALRYFARLDEIIATLHGCAESMAEVADLARRHGYRCR